jgi:hypothetical protein
MNKGVSLGAVVGGVLLVISSVGATDSFTCDVSRFLAGSHAAGAICALIGGAVMLAVGAIARLCEPR